MKKYIKPSIETQIVEVGLILDVSPVNEMPIKQGTSGEDGLTKGIDCWEEEYDDFG